MIKFNIIVKRKDMKKKKLWILPAILLVLALAYLGFRLIRFNRLADEVNTFDIKIEDRYTNIGVFDDKLYYLDGKILHGRKTDQELFQKDLGSGVKSLVYDKYIYVFYEDGKILTLDRYSAKEKKSLDLGVKVARVRRDKDRFIIYSTKDVISIAKDLSDKRVRKFSERPLDYREEGNSYTCLYLSMDIDDIKSRLVAYEGEKEVFRLASVDELFMGSGYFTEKKSYGITNRSLYLIEDSSIIDRVNLAKPRAFKSDGNKLALVDNMTLKVFDTKLDIMGSVDLGFEAKQVFFIDDAIICLGDKMISSYEAGNLIKNDLVGLKGYYKGDKNIYLIFSDRVEKVKVD